MLPTKVSRFWEIDTARASFEYFWGRILTALAVLPSNISVSLVDLLVSHLGPSSFKTARLQAFALMAFVSLLGPGASGAWPPELSQ